jgi:gluconokinase
VLVAGVAGSGKTTVGRMLADRLHWRFADTDSFHPASNIAKMAAGIPLTDADRVPWLAAIGSWMDARVAAGDPAVAGCSALRRSYRDQLLTGRPSARLAFLDISREAADARLVARTGHFFTARLLDSQFADLEPPAQGPQVLVLDGAQPADTITGEIIARLGLTAGAAPGQSTSSPAPPDARDRKIVHATRPTEAAVTTAQDTVGPQARVYQAARQEKPWGHELIFAAVDGKYAGKIIHVNAGQSLSLQYHNEKEETISVISGEALVQHGPAADQLVDEHFGTGDTIHLPPGVLHRITAISDLDFAEASTASPGWREDVVRLEDRYGRSGTTAP